jgi:arylsulfatase A-like enzyme
MNRRRQPNILLFIPDQLRADAVGPGNALGTRTPNVDRLMRRGVNFTRAICPSPLCGPSRACLATGLEYDRNPVPSNAFSISETGPNLYRQMAGTGYEVLTCGKVDLLKGELDWGRDGQHTANGISRLKQLGFTGGLDSAGKHATLMAYDAGAPEPYICFLRDRGLEDAYVADMRKRRSFALGPDRILYPGAGPNYVHTLPSDLPEDAYQDNWIGQCGLDLLDAAATSGRPWFLQVNLAGPHEPVNITKKMAASVTDRDPPLPANRGGLDAEQHRAIRRNYVAMAENVDAIFGRYIAMLERTGQLDNTIVIFTSDHGEMLGDAALWEKSVGHQPAIGVPLVIAGPGVVAGGRTDQPATILDLHATLLALSGADPLPDVDSRSLLPVLADPSVRLRDVVFSGLGNWRIAFDGRFKMVAGYVPGQSRGDSERGTFTADDSATWRLVDPFADPEENGNLCAAEPERCAALRAALENELTRSRAAA